jgi:hypothetical protein
MVWTKLRQFKINSLCFAVHATVAATDALNYLYCLNLRSCIISNLYVCFVYFVLVWYFVFVVKLQVSKWEIENNWIAVPDYYYYYYYYYIYLKHFKIHILYKSFSDKSSKLSLQPLPLKVDLGNYFVRTIRIGIGSISVTNFTFLAPSFDKPSEQSYRHMSHQSNHNALPLKNMIFAKIHFRALFEGPKSNFANVPPPAPLPQTLHIQYVVITDRRKLKTRSTIVCTSYKIV